MGNSYSADHIAKDRKHSDITCNPEDSKQKYRLETVSNRLLGRVKYHCASALFSLWHLEHYFTNCILVDSSYVICLTCALVILGVSGLFYRLYSTVKDQKYFHKNIFQ